MRKKILGQFFTTKNVFEHPAFLSWFLTIDESKRTRILEPFAGQNGLIDMLEELKLIREFESFDIQPQNAHVKKKDTIKYFPKGFEVCITNPPFLAKNIATRKNIDVVIEPFGDLYEKCLDICLKNCSYVAAIVPESFIVSDFFKTRLKCVISLNQKMLFKHTEHPVCLALFGSEISSDFEVFVGSKRIGYFKELKKQINSWLEVNKEYPIKFHQPTGSLGLLAIDATDINKKMKFCNGEDIQSKDVGYHARLRTRIQILTPRGKELTNNQNKKFIKICNEILNDYRRKTEDIFLTAFKGLRSDGYYRRRLDFYNARKIVNKAYEKMFG